MNQDVETLTSSDSQSFFGHLTSEQDIPLTHTLRQISHWNTHTHTHTHNHQCVSKNWRYLLNISWWTLTESMWSGMEISPFWEPIHDAAFMATNCHSTCCSILQPYNQIRARRVTHTDPSTCVQTIIHCICNWTQSSLSHYFITSLTCAGFWLVSSSSVFSNTSASVVSRSQQPDAFGEKPAAVTGPSGDQEQLNSTICMFTEITVLKFNSI